ncbi:hypothetical protein LJC04_01530 [Ruminococcaceae bacterium OttesenSCG-928-O06]|nr:hypothetical protein [Ruminococcaceae bacterium OttesenSCG-928-O06]
MTMQWTEETLLDETLRLLQGKGPPQAYAFLRQNEGRVHAENRGQIYNFSYCLAALCGQVDEALAILAKATREGYWWRPEVFCDEDLQSLQGHPDFEALREESCRRYAAAQSGARWQCSWAARRHPGVLLALHGNQQNATHAKNAWQDVTGPHMQLETLQAALPDSYGLYRWQPGDDSEARIAWQVNSLRLAGHRTVVLGGFSAGCGAIARALARQDTRCEAAVFAAPWLPGLEEVMENLVENLVRHGTRLLVVCGTQDVDCLPGATLLASRVQDAGGHCTLELPAGLGHAFAPGFAGKVGAFLHGAPAAA